ncbi:M28 family peptidase, partial [bacterium]|nr:M28 family peptidase [bacterium]
MKQVRASLFVVFIMTASLAGANPLPVVIDQRVSNHESLFDDLGFQLHARSGSTLIGTIQDEAALPKNAGIYVFDKSVTSFENIYQIHPRFLNNHPQIAPRIDALFSTKDLILFQAAPDLLNALASAGIPFRAVPGKPRPSLDLDNGGSNLDTMDPFVGVILDQVTASSYQNFLQTLQDFVTRNTYNDRSVDAANWILEQFQAMGLDAWLDSFEIGGLTRYNVIAEMTGSEHPLQMYYLTAHLDATAGFPIFPEDETPGADDDGSGAALVLECAKVMSQFTFQNTVRFALFCGNEQGTVGSEAYVAGLPQTGEIYLGVFNADMIGWSGDDNWPPDLVIYTNDDPSSIILADKLQESVELFVTGFLEVITVQDATMVYADHGSFWDANIPAVLTMEDEVMGGDLNPYYHSDQDLIDYIDFAYALHVTEAILGAVADLAVPNGAANAYLFADGVTIDDSQGNNNGRLEYGESISLTIPIINAGGGDAISVNAVLSESDPYITITDWVENYGTIQSGDTIEVTNAFSADVTVNVPDEHQFEITMLMSAGAEVWSSQVQIVAHAPQIEIDELTVDDTQGGNGNYQLEPGESADVLVAIVNDGSFEAADLVAQLTTSNAYIVINSGPQTIGTLEPDSLVIAAFNVSALQVAPAFFYADFNIDYQAAGGWTAVNNFTLEVGDLTHVPTGPDAHGYSAYDPNDQPYAPVYNWIEIDPGQGGPGTELDFNDDDETLIVDLPFTFVYYGQQYTQLSVCSNGWLACGATTNTDYSNSPIPDEDGPSAMISPFWDDLSPQAEGSTSYYYDAANNWFIVEYYEVRDFYPSWDNMTFEVILYDPLQYPTITGDGEIL